MYRIISHKRDHEFQWAVVKGEEILVVTDKFHIAEWIADLANKNRLTTQKAMEVEEATIRERGWKS